MTMAVAALRRDGGVRLQVGSLMKERVKAMTQMMIICAVVLLICVTTSKLLYRFGVPVLVAFLALGMVFGSDGIGGIYFDNFELASNLSSIGLVVIMFYGGFGTSWKEAKPVAVRAVLLSSLGTVITAGLTGLFCFLVLRRPLLEGLLIGSVIASTDAASVFSILRSHKLGLKGGLASLLEVESGSNDPFAYMLTIIILYFMKGEPFNLVGMLFSQIVYGIGIGALLALAAVFVLRRGFEIEGLYPVFVIAVAILGYALSDYLGGNGFLCVYIIGLIVGNSKILHKKSLVHFFDGLSWLMQIMLFFVLGLLSFPSQMPKVLLPGVLVALFILFVARPAATFGILSWFKVPIKQQVFVSWVGLRGAASIVFAIYAVTEQVHLGIDIFHMVFFVALFSVLAQGSLTPLFAKKLDLVEEPAAVLKTFTDYTEETPTRLLEYPIPESSALAGKAIMDADIPEEILIVMVKRHGDVVLPKGSTVLQKGDVLVLSGNNLDAFAEPPV